MRDQHACLAVPTQARARGAAPSALAALAGPAIGAAAVVAAFDAGFSSSFKPCWAADSVGIVIAAPWIILILHAHGQRQLNAWRKIELSTLFAALPGATIGVVQVL